MTVWTLTAAAWNRSQKIVDMLLQCKWMGLWTHLKDRHYPGQQCLPELCFIKRWLSIDVMDCIKQG